MTIKKIAHIADIHIYKSTKRHEEYKEVFNKLIVSLRNEKPDRIVLVGDLFNDYIKIEGELLILASKFLNALAKIAPVVITRGNHDILKSAPNRVDSIQAVVETIANPNIRYLNTTGFVADENIVWAVWKHGERKNNPWDDKSYTRDESKIYIDLFHDPINGCVNADGFTFESKTYRTLKDFKGDFSFFGDIHKNQFFLQNTKAYSGSLIAQNYSEGNSEFHGYVLWDIEKKTHKNISIPNDHDFHTVSVNRYTDFENLDIDIPNISARPNIRVKWQTLPATKNVTNEKLVLKHLTQRYNPVSVKYKAEFVEENKVDIQENSVIENITKREVLHQIMTEYLTKIGVEEEIIKEIINLDVEIESRIEIEDVTNIQWSILKFIGKNFRNIGDVNIDWRDKDGLYQITGKNTAGKSSVIQLLSYILYGKTLETDKAKKFGDARFVNNRNGARSCEGSIVLTTGGEYYGIKRTTTLSYTKEGALKASPTVVSYYKLNDPDDVLGDETNINKFDDVTKHKTQKRIDEIIGTYDNFIRIILTTADTLNRILDTDSSVFIDSILADSGVNVCDLRLTEFKKYKKEVVNNTRIPCNPEIEEAAIAYLNSQNYEKKSNIHGYEKNLINYTHEITRLENLRDNELVKIHQIDKRVSEIDIVSIKTNIVKFEKELKTLGEEELRLISQINALPNDFNENRLSDLIKEKDAHKTKEFTLRTQINNINATINNIESQIIRNNGEIELLMREGANYKAEIFKQRENKVCSKCGQPVTEESHKHIEESIKQLEVEMYGFAKKIKEFQAKNLELKSSITLEKDKIKNIENLIDVNNGYFENNIIEIGELNDIKIQVEKRNTLANTLTSIPLKKENITLKINSLTDDLNKYNDSKIQIAENEKILIEAQTYTKGLEVIRSSMRTESQQIAKLTSDIEYNNKQIEVKTKQLDQYKEQLKMDRVYELYEKCVHRDGVPTQILKNILIPKINNSISDLLQSVDFDVWLDDSDLKLKMSYTDHPDAIIDCIGGSGKERCFSTLSLKQALNEINNKSKPTIFILDEVMGKLKDESIDEFLQFLNVIKQRVNKLIIIEQNHEINPDYVISAAVNSNKVSTIKLED